MFLYQLFRIDGEKEVLCRSFHQVRLMLGFLSKCVYCHVSIGLLNLQFEFQFQRARVMGLIFEAWINFLWMIRSCGYWGGDYKIWHPPLQIQSSVHMHYQNCEAWYCYQKGFLWNWTTQRRFRRRYMRKQQNIKQFCAIWWWWFWAERLPPTLCWWWCQWYRICY
jgi:hypothetical protein